MSTLFIWVTWVTFYLPRFLKNANINKSADTLFIKLKIEREPSLYLPYGPCVKNKSKSFSSILTALINYKWFLYTRARLAWIKLNLVTYFRMIKVSGKRFTWRFDVAPTTFSSYKIKLNWQYFIFCYYCNIETMSKMFYAILFFKNLYCICVFLQPQNRVH